MGLFDLPAPLFDAVDGMLGLVLPPVVRLGLWGVLAGWVTMLAYRRLSNQDRIKELKQEQKTQQAALAAFDGEFEEMWPLIRGALSLGFRQLGLALGPALLATVPVLFLVVWVSGQFGYHQPQPGQPIAITSSPTDAPLEWRPAQAAQVSEGGWKLTWPDPGSSVEMLADGQALLRFPTDKAVPVIHRKLWWNWLVANPIGYLPDGGSLQQVNIALPPQQFLALGPGWVRGWMFTFFGVFLLASLAFKFILKVD